jgi:DNA invertase Pin-like site-specific DNA recombinase
MSRVGYARVSSYGQSLDVQLEKLNKDGCERIFGEKMSGRSAEAREELQNCLQWVREGDVLVVTKLDRLARSTRDLLNVANMLEQKKVSLVVLDQQIDTGSPTGKLLFVMLGAIAEFENEIRKDRQVAGVAMARKKGVRFGRKVALQPVQIQELKRRRTDGEKISALMSHYGLSKATLYRYLGEGSKA